MSGEFDSETFETFISKYASHPVYKAPRGNRLNAKSWQTEAPLRMLLNNLDDEVAESPKDLVIYGGTGQAARNPDALKKNNPVPLIVRG